MLKSLKKKMKDQAGLTLIELLVVIVILGIIAAIAIPMVMSNKDKAEINANKQTLSVLQDAVNRYQTVEGAVPTATSNLVDKGYVDSWPTTCAGDVSGSFSLSSNGKKVETTCKVSASSSTNTGNTENTENTEG